jgi:hypothetical protein
MPSTASLATNPVEAKPRPIEQIGGNISQWMIRSEAMRETIICMMPLWVSIVLFGALFIVASLAFGIDRACQYAGSISQPPGSELSGWACAEFFLNRYQTVIGVLIGATVTLYAASRAWAGLQHQIQHAERLDRRQRQQRHAALRAMLSRCPG